MPMYLYRIPSSRRVCMQMEIYMYTIMTYIPTSIYARTYIHTFIHAYVPKTMLTAYIRVHNYMHACIFHKYVFIYVRIYIYTRIHIAYLYTYVYTCIRCADSVTILSQSCLQTSIRTNLHLRAPSRRCPKDHMNSRMLRPGGEAQYKGDSRNHVLWDRYVCVAFWGLS